MESEPIEEQLAIRDRFRRARIKCQTPEQRMAAFWALQQSAFAILRSNPDAYDRFLRHNLRKRAISWHPDPA